MIAFEIHHNDVRLCTAGIEKFGVVSAIFTLVRRKKSAEEPPEIVVGGLFGSEPKDYEDVEWVKSALAKGDEIKIKMVDVDQHDPPVLRKLSDLNFVGKQKERYERREYKRLKKKYEG